MYYLLLPKNVTTKLQQSYNGCRNKFIVYRGKKNDNVMTKQYLRVLICRLISTTIYQVRNLLIFGVFDNITSG